MSPEISGKFGKSVGERLRAARIAQHFTQSQLASPDFSVSYISAIERGQIHPSLRALEILANRLGLNATQLLPHRAQPDERTRTLLQPSELNEEEIELFLLEVALLIKQEEYHEALRQLEECNPHRLKRPQQLQLRYLQGLAYYHLGQYQESEFALAEAEQFMREVNTPYLHIRILDLLASTHAAMHNTAQALQLHQHCLALLEATEQNNPFFAIHVYTALGQEYIRLEQIDTAIETFRKALEIAGTLTSNDEIQATYIRLCQQYTSEKTYDLAQMYGYKALHAYQQHAIQRFQSEIYYYLGHALYTQNPKTAHSYIEEALQQPAIQHNPLVYASLLTRSAEWHLSQDQTHEAMRLTRQALALVEAGGDSTITAEAFIMLGRAEYALQHTHDGDTHFVRGLDMLERLGNQQELADESVRYAELLEQTGRERDAFTFFRRAFQSRQKLGK